MKPLLLDANIFRNLACGKYPDHEQAICRLGKQRLLATCDLTVRELLANMSEYPGNTAHIIRTLGWMDRLCGNSGMTAPFPAPILKVFLDDYADDRHEKDRIGINKLRRRILREFRDGHPSDSLVHEISRQVENLKENQRDWLSYVPEMTSVLVRAMRRMKSEQKLEGKSKPQHKELKEKLATLMAETSRKNFESRGFRTKEAAGAQVHLREYYRAQVGIMWKAHVEPFKRSIAETKSIKAHENDLVDTLILSYCALGYAVVSCDGRIHSALDEGNCEHRRVLKEQEFLRELGNY